MPAKTIEEVVDQLTGILDQSRREQSRAGYFAAFYRNVTIRVRDGIAAGEFQNGSNVGQLTAAAAARYLECVGQRKRGETIPTSWKAAFDAAGSRTPIVLQHLVLGVNAHINVDLGIAAAEVCPGDQVSTLATDFDKIHALWFLHLRHVEAELLRISPWISLLDRLGARTRDGVLNFSMPRAQRASWRHAVELAPLSGAVLERRIRDIDTVGEMLARLILKPGRGTRLGLGAIRCRESNDVRQAIDLLSGGR